MVEKFLYELKRPKDTVVTVNGIDVPVYNGCAGPGVYLLINKESGEVYVGKSKKVHTRLQEHLKAMNECRHAPKVQMSFNKSKSHMPFIIKMVTHTADAKFESWLIKHLDTVNNGLNTYNGVKF